MKSIPKKKAQNAATSEALDLRSMNIPEEKQKELLRLLPEIRTEGGRLDFEKLRLALGDAVDVGKERYGMTWPGKAECFNTIQKPTLATLRPCPDESVDFETSENLIIEGDNLEVLKLLQKSYLGKVKMIYIDPPYNTGNDFIYPDNYSESLRTYLEYTGQVDAQGKKFSTNTETDGRFHSKWLNMMYSRLYLAKNLLADDGIIAVSVDHNELTNLQVILGDLFGEENSINTIVWVNNLKGRQISSHGAALTHEFIVVWAKNKDLVEEFTVNVEWAKSRMPSAYKGFEYDVSRDEKGEYVLKNQLYNTNSAFNEATRPNLVFNILYNPSTAEVRAVDIDDVIAPEGFQLIEPHRCNDGQHKYHAWRWSRTKVEQEADDLAFVSSEQGFRVYTKVRGYTTTVLKDLITDISTNEGARDVELILGSCPFDFPKPVALIQLLIQCIPAAEQEAVILDFFAGSGTTGHAVIAQNATDGVKRKYILVQLPERLDPKNIGQKGAVGFCDNISKPHNLAELTKERIRRASASIRTERPDYDGDLGFRVFKLDESNFTTWDANASDDAEKLAVQLTMHIDHIRPGRTSDDLLYEILLKSGFPINTPVKTEAVAGKTIRSVENGSFIICLENALTLELIRKIAEMKPVRVVFLDAGFAGNDQLKANAVQIFKAKGVAKFLTV